MGGLKHENNTLRIRWYLFTPPITTPAVEKNQRLRANNCIGVAQNLFNPKMTINEGAFLTSLTRVRFPVNAMTFFLT